MPVPTASPDPWTFFLDWLTTVMVPSWGDLVALMPYFLVLFVIGPILTLLVLGWAWHLLRRRRGHVRREVVQPVPAPIGADGSPQFPANVPYCEEHALLYPPRERRCEIDRADLLVACPVDGTVRAADIRTCPSCGTTYILGAGTSALLVTSTGGPPEGGAAIA